MKKIVHIIEATATGTLSVALMAVNEQCKYNKVYVIYSIRDDTPKDIIDMFDNRIEFFQLGLGKSYFPMSIFNLRNILNTIVPDIIHCHSSFAGFIGRFASLGLKSRMFYSPHCISFMREDIGYIKRFIFRNLEKFANIKSSVYIACSLSEKKAIEYALPSVHVVLLENAIPDLGSENIDDDDLKTVDIDEHVFTVVTVGGIRTQKGFQEFCAISNSFHDTNIRFLWIGDGDFKARRLLEEAGVEVSGWKSKQEVLAILHSSDLYLSTSLWEGMPVSVIEACSIGVPLALRACPGNVDIIEKTEDGFLFLDTDEAIDFIRVVSKKPLKYKKIAMDNRNRMIDRFSISRFNKQLESIYNINK